METTELKTYCDTKFKQYDDSLEDLREMREADRLIHHIQEIGEQIDEFLAKNHKLEQRIKTLETDKPVKDLLNNEDISNDDLFNAWKKSGVTLKEIAVHLLIEPTQSNIALMSRLMNGHVRDIPKRVKAYKYCIDKII